MGAGIIGFLVVLALVVASILLFRSMSRHLRKVPTSFDRPTVGDDEVGPNEH
jgi:hypothetical protein